MTTTPLHRVVIVGSGFGGLFAARILRRAPVTVTIVSKTNHHLFQPLLYQVATGILSEGGIAPATRDVVRHFENTSVELAEVTDIDVEHRLVNAIQWGEHLQFPYDSLIVAAGVTTSYFGHDEYSNFAPGMKTIDDALELRGRIFGAFEIAESQSDPEVRAAWLTFAIVGGGPTGVEMAGQIAELSRRSLRGNFRSLDPRAARVVLFEGGERILESFGKRLSAKATEDLEQLGVEIHTHAMVTGIDEDGVDVQHEDGTMRRLPAHTKVWAAGMKAAPLAAQLAHSSGAEVDRAGRIRVLPDCSLPGHPEVFVVGDMMCLDDLPGMAEVAIQSGIHAGLLIKRRQRDATREAVFRYRDLGSIAAVSRFRAVAKFGPVGIGGFAGWLFWLLIHLTFLTGYKNRVGALSHWAISFIGRGRSERTITRQQVIARHALKRGGQPPRDAVRRSGQ
jgi:NADH:ubiquinone reductase (H+-translocating)